MRGPRSPAAARGDRVLLVGLHALGVVLIAGLVHVASVLATPRFSARDAYARVAGLAGGRALATVAAPPARDPALPYRDPAVASSFCLYDLRAAPARVEVDVKGAPSVSVSLHDRHGRAFYGLTNRSASNGRIALVVMTAAQFAEAEARDTGDEGESDLRVTADEVQGFAEVDVLATASDALPEARARAARMSCAVAAQQP